MSTNSQNRMKSQVYDIAALLGQASALANQESPLLTEVAGVALGLAACRQAIDEAIEPLKTIFREAAREEREDPNDVIEFDGVLEDGESAGVVTVSFQAARPTMKKSSQAETLRRLLGPELETYFEVKTVLEPRRDFVEVCNDRRSRHPTEVAVALRNTDVIEPVARVGFRPLPSVIPISGMSGK